MYPSQKISSSAHSFFAPRFFLRNVSRFSLRFSVCTALGFCERMNFSLHGVTSTYDSVSDCTRQAFLGTHDTWSWLSCDQRISCFPLIWEQVFFSNQLSCWQEQILSAWQLCAWAALSFSLLFHTKRQISPLTFFFSDSYVDMCVHVLFFWRLWLRFFLRNQWFFDCMLIQYRGTIMGFCIWANKNAANKHYHDTEWGIPVHDDRFMFEHLTLECLQCGLSWDLMLRKREIIRQCFSNFDYTAIAQYTTRDVERILQTEGMIRSERKVVAVINNARCAQALCEDYGSFCAYIWSYSSGKTILYEGHAQGRIPVSNALSANISQDLKKRGFKYVGPVTIYSHLQACGIINDHDSNCPCYQRINSTYPTIIKAREGEVFWTFEAEVCPFARISFEKTFLAKIVRKGQPQSVLHIYPYTARR